MKFTMPISRRTQTLIALLLLLETPFSLALPTQTKSTKKATPPVEQSKKISPPAESTKKAPPVEQHFNAAETFQLAGDLEKASAEYRQGISVALQRIGNLKLAEGDTAKGMELLRGAVASDPKNVDAAVDLGIALFRKGEYDNAKTTVASVLKNDPSDFRARNLLGKIDFMQGNFQGAIDQLKAALAIEQDFDVAYTLALANLELKNLPQATVLFDEMRSSQGKTPELHVLLGQAYRQTGYFDLAVQEFKRVLELEPSYPHAHGYLGVTYVSMGGDKNYELAMKEFRQELVVTPGDYSSNYFLGSIALDRHDLGSAETSLQEARRVHPDDPGLMLLLGRLYNEQKKWPDAIAELRHVVESSSASAIGASQLALAHELLSKAYSGAGQSVESASELKLAEDLRKTEGANPKNGSSQNGIAGAQDLGNMLMDIGQKPKTEIGAEANYISMVSRLLGNAYNNLGVIDARAGNFPGAAEEFKQAGQWDSSIPQVDRNWALAAYRAESYTDAIGPLKRLLERQPGDENLRQMLGVSYYMSKDFRSSADTFRPIVMSLPDNPGVLLAAGISFVKAGDSNDGAHLIDRALVVGNATPEIHLMIGQAYAEQKQEAQALSEFRRALELNPKLPEAHFYIGMVLFADGDLENAADQFRLELKVNTDYVPALYQLAYVRLQNHQLSDAMPLLKQVIKLQPDHSDAHYQLGKALLEQGDLNGATRELEISIRLHPTDYAYFQLSRAYSRAGRANDAKEAERNYNELKPKPTHL
jgi:tetratricopeptide (TPR) repeat protein